MAKLADVTAEIRIILKILTASLIVIGVLFLFLQGGKIFKNVFFPTPPPPPTQKFGKLPAIAFPENKLIKLDYRINTLDGTMPFLKDRINTYAIKESAPSLVALQNTRDMLINLEYTGNETQISGSIYQWSNANGSHLQYNVATKNFKITSDIFGAPPTPGSAFLNISFVLERTMDILNNLGEDTSDIDPEKTTYSYLKIENGTLLETKVQSEAQFTRINLFQKNVNNYQVYYPAKDESTMYFIFSNDAGGLKISDASFYHYPVDGSKASDYPTITSEQAFENLKNGKGYVMYGGESGATIDITEISLGYYIGEVDQGFFLPVVIFKGNSFQAYVQATPSDLIAK